LALPPPMELGPDEELVAGRRPVEEAFVARRPARRLLVVPQRRQALERIVLHATNLRIPIVEVEGGSLTALAGFDGHQGVALVVEPRVFAGIDDVLARAAERGEPPFILVLDSLEDPHNVGTLLRSAEAAGVHGVLFPTHRQAPLSPSAVKASAGAIEHLLLAPVDDLAGALTDLRARGLRIAGADSEASLTARETDLRGPLAIVVGSEGQGLGPTVRRRADVFMRIPMRGAVGSLNAAVAGSILLFEAVAQRDPGGRSDPVAPEGAATEAGQPAEEEPKVPTAKARTATAPKLRHKTLPTAAAATRATRATTATRATKAAPPATRATKAAPPATRATKAAPPATRATKAAPPVPGPATSEKPSKARVPARSKRTGATAAKVSKAASKLAAAAAPEPASTDDELLPGGERPARSTAKRPPPARARRPKAASPPADPAPE
jgi:23S rRNA (guanosine2251-2'-O)-methyltransferase